MTALNFLKSRKALHQVPEDKVLQTYKTKSLRALVGVFICYAAYYFVRNNFVLSTPHLMKLLSLSKADIGILSSCMLITYGISKGIMSSLADLCNPKRYMLLGLLLSCIVNICMGFSSGFYLFVIFVILNGVFQGMGPGPSFITIASWYPRMQRGRVGAIWNISHNIGGGIVAPIILGAFAIFGATHWQAANYWAPAVAALIVAIVFLFVGVGTTYNEGLPPVDKIIPSESGGELVKTHSDGMPPNSTAWTIFRDHVLKNKLLWLVSLVDSCVYLVRFGVITWVPIYLLQEKGLTNTQMSTAFAFFEWSAIPTTLIAGVLSDKLFKGRRMPLAIFCMCLILVALMLYWKSSSLFVVTGACAAVGLLIYPPQFLASVVTMEIVPRYAVGSAVGLRGFMSYIVGATIGTALLGKLVDLYGWDAGFYLLISGAVLCIIFSIMCHLGTVKLEQKHKQAKEEDAAILNNNDAAQAS